MLNVMPTPEQRLRKASIAIMAHQEYIAMNGVFMIGTKRVEADPTKCPTAYTDGVNEVYGLDFVDKCNDAELRFVMIHECEHKMRRDLRVHRHLWKINPHVANIAMDHVINIGIVKRHQNDGFATMTGPLASGCCDMKYDGGTTERVFYDLLKQSEGEREGGGTDEGFDDHGWDAAEEMSEEQAKELDQQIQQALQQGAIMAGKLGSGANRTIDGLLNPPIDWREALREFIVDTCTGNDYSTYRRPNRKYLSAGLYMPSGATDKIGRVVAAVDMSGSVGNREQAIVLGAAVDMAEQVKPEGIDLIYWDTKVANHEFYDEDGYADLRQRTKPAGGGGTNVECVPPFLAEQSIDPQCAIVLTDGYLGGGWGDWPCPVLWIILDNPNATPPFGSVVHVDSRGM